MKLLNPDKLHVTFLTGTASVTKNKPRRYTLTHSDLTGNLFLTIGDDYDKKQISGLYTRLMRDEVLAELITNEELSIYCHGSGGLVIEAIRYGDRTLFERYPGLDQIPVKVYFKSHKSRYHQTENWGVMADYK